MPRPTVLSHGVQAHFNGTRTLDPVPRTTRPPVQSPESAWATIAPQHPGGDKQLLLAYLSSSVPASLQPDGSLRPDYQYVLAWVDYGKHLPFDTATVSWSSLPPGGLRQPTCTFVGQDVTAWDATTEQRILDAAEVVPRNGHALDLRLNPWTSVRTQSSEKMVGDPHRHRWVVASHYGLTHTYGSERSGCCIDH